MTLQEHLTDIRQYLQLQGATEQEAIFFQLYLICLGKTGLRKEGQPATTFLNANQQEFRKVLDPIWTKTDAGSKKGVMSHFFEDLDLDYIDDDVYDRTFHEILIRDARENGRVFDHYQPGELTELVKKLSEYKEGLSVYNPYAGVGSYASCFKAGNNYYGEEFEPLIWAIGVLKMWIENCESSNYICGDSLQPSWTEQFDLVVSSPPMGRIEGQKMSFGEKLVSDATTLLKTDGIMIVVTNVTSLSPKASRLLVESNLLDMVIAFPSNVFYWSAVSPLILRLKNGRGKSEPVTMVDGTGFFTHGGRWTKVIDSQKLLGALINKNPDYVRLVCPRDFETNSFSMIPALYFPLKGKGQGGGDYTRLKDLGEWLTPRIYSGKPEKGIRIQDLVSDPYLIDVEPALLQGNIDRYRQLEEPALLIFATHKGVRLGYAHASKENPIFLAPRILVFIPNRKIVDIRYLAIKLLDAELAFQGSSLLMVTKTELALTAIQVIPLEEQSMVVRQLMDKYDSNKAVAGGNIKRKPNLVLVGEPLLPEDIRKSIAVKKSFSSSTEAGDWLKLNEKKVDAVIVRQNEKIDGLEIFMLNQMIHSPVYIISDHLLELEDIFKRRPEAEITKHCFPPGFEKELFNSLCDEIAERNSPERLMRDKYAAQLEAARSIESRFPERGWNLQDTIEGIILSNPDDKDWRNKLRTIRDDCFLRVLIDYGYLPPLQPNFNLGALVDFLADRYYCPSTESGYCFILLKEIVPEHLGALLKATKVLLNEGSHTLKRINSDIQMAALHTIFALLMCLNRMIDSASFEESERNIPKGYWRKASFDEFEGGLERVVRVASKHNGNDYYYAGNCHLDGKTCLRYNLKAGDKVVVYQVSREKKPYVDDVVQVWFYSQSFEKVG